MATQINLKMTDDFFEQADEYAKKHGFMSIQEFIREAVREKLYDEPQIRQEYLDILNSKEANTFLADKDSREFERNLYKKARIK